MSGKKVLITGGFGNLGSWISRYLPQSQYDIYILTRKEKRKIPDIKYQTVECDITNINELEEKLNFDIDFCIHCASFNEFFVEDYAQKALEINSLGTRNIIEVLSTKNLKNFIYLSTFHVYGENSGTITENTPLNPKNDYASTHLFAEYYIKQFGFTHNLQYTILRLTNSYGTPMFKDSDKWYLVLNDLSKSAYKNGKIVIKSNGKAKRDFIYMGDVVKVLESLMKIDATNTVYNLSSSQSFEVIELANIVKDVYEKRYKQAVSIEINSSDKTIYHDIVVKNEKLKSVIDYKTDNKISQEVSKIFDLLEDKDGK